MTPSRTTSTAAGNRGAAAPAREADSTGGFLPAVPLLALDRQYAVLRDEIRSALDRVCDSGKFVLGPDVHDLEAELARALDVPHVISCASGSDALLLALMALDVKPGDEVILPSYTFFATASAVTRLNAVPIFADIDPVTYLVDPTDVKKKISRRTKAIVPVHLFGRTADMDAILPIAKAAGLPVVEDAAQSILSTWHGRCSGALGDVGCFSFYPTKNLGGVGDGGFLTTTRDDIAAQLKLLRVHGMEPRYYHQVVGINSRLDSLQAAVLRVKLPHLDAWTTARQVNAARYQRLFAASGLADHVAVPGDEPRGRHVWNQFVIRAPGGRRDALRKHLAACGVGTEIYYPVPLHMQQCFGYLGWQKGDLPQTELAAEETLALPIFPELTEAEQRTVVGRIAEFFEVRQPQQQTDEIRRTHQPEAVVEEPHFVRRMNAVGRADDVRC
ncbi:MAG: DegT/DnrJ/EryC1/StrS family aminotransferase [Planctomycetia bacterium]